jgi:hypothetical protein
VVLAHDSSTLLLLDATLAELSTQSMLKKVLWRERVSGWVSEANTAKPMSQSALGPGETLFGPRLTQLLYENWFETKLEPSRKADVERLFATLGQVGSNDDQILQVLSKSPYGLIIFDISQQFLQVPDSQMQDAMIAISKVLLPPILQAIHI